MSTGAASAVAKTVVAVVAAAAAVVLGLNPVIDDSRGDARVRGCLSLDGPAGRFDDLTSDEVLSLLGWAAQGLLHQAP
jgi:hypothetical protein